MDELHQQTVNLLSFQPLPKDVFDTQVAFNLVAATDRSRSFRWIRVEESVRRHYQKIAGTDALPARADGAAASGVSRLCVWLYSGDGADCDQSDCRRRWRRSRYDRGR